MAQLRIAHLRFLIPFAVLAWRATLPLGDNSFLWHVRAGAVQLDAGEVLRTDPFSFTAFGEAWRTQSWLAELAYGWLERMTDGIDWVPLMKFLAMGVTLAVLGLVIHRVDRGRHWVTLGGMFLLLWQAAPFGIARPALLGFLLLALTVAVAHTPRAPLWLLPPLFWLWAAVHGMFAVGLGYLFLEGLRRRSRKQLVVVGVSGLATALTAHGLGTWWIVIQFLKNRGALELISEWQPPDFSNPFLMPLLVVITGLIVAGALGRLAVAALWVVLPFVGFGLLAERNVVGLLQPLEAAEERFPTRDAVAALDTGQPLFNGSAVGGYLIYADWPDIEVFIDDRAELYGAEGFQRFHDLKSGIGVEETFAELGIEQALVSTDWPIVEYLELLGWDYRFEDENFVVMGAS